ncbi:glycosyltransferase [Mobilitalea sibirica]|uniref:Glycosyltransferase n=1 Tax=Mobilitalea sibirica TaxID=1462919 RepID=A0A8J7L1W9_9FIRM|nr:glycosyltransferase [Mobilitalea sibirica]MBH1939413.1 glycosyltransferase [Mobilitalea sibirica]
MKVLLITMAWPKYGEYNLYSDLMQEFYRNGHDVTVVTVNEKAIQQKSSLRLEEGLRVLRVRTGNIQKTNKYKKVIASFFAGPRLLCAIHKYLKHAEFNLILFSTPPITLTPFVVLMKKHYRASLYLLLKDIWPQDTVDLGGMRYGGLVWGVFRYLEKLTYRHADYIGCMSPAGVNYIKKHNRYLKNKVIEVCPNSIRERKIISVDREAVRKKYGLPMDKPVFIYGGNLGKAQGISFLADILREYLEESKVFILIVGSGTEYEYLHRKITQIKPVNAKLIPSLSVREYEELVRACDIGLIFLYKNSTVPNFPSRLLTYLNASLPVIACVDPATDLGMIIESAGCGILVNSGNMNDFRMAVEQILKDEDVRKSMGINSYRLLREHYTVDISYQIIISHYENKGKKGDKELERTNKYFKNKEKILPLKRKLKSFILTNLYIAVHFICYGDLPTSYYVKKGMKVGKNFYRQTGTKFDPSHCYLIEIGDNVTVANNVQILAHDQSQRVHMGYGKVGKVIIGDNSFIGARVTILPNVVIGDNVIIGAGSVVTKDIPSDSVAVGVPAKVIGSTKEYIERCKKELLVKPVFDTSFVGTKLSCNKKKKIKNACKDSFAYIELGKVYDYKKRKSPKVTKRKKNKYTKISEHCLNTVDKALLRDPIDDTLTGKDNRD